MLFLEILLGLLIVCGVFVVSWLIGAYITVSEENDEK